MVKVCVYCNRKYPDGNITFHKFPSDKERRKKWLNAMKIPNENIDKNSYLCSEHFEDNTFSYQIVNNRVQRFLYIDAVPSTFQTCNILKNEDFQSFQEKKNHNQNVGVTEDFDQCNNDEEHFRTFYYKIVNGIIQRFLRNDDQIYTPLSMQHEINREEQLLIQGKTKSDPHFDAKKSDIKADCNLLPDEEPARVVSVPDNRQPLAYRNGETSEDNKMETDDPYLQLMQDYSTLNGINEIEVTTSEEKSSNVKCINAIDSSHDTEMKAETLKEDIVHAESTNKDSINNESPAAENIGMQSTVKEENNENVCMKKLLYECLEDKDDSDFEYKLGKYNKKKLTQLMRTALNYIECLENKLKFTSDINSQYEMQIKRLQNLLLNFNNI